MTNEPAHHPVHICQCGCGEPIPFKPAHLRRPPKYIAAHYRGMYQKARIEASRAAKLRDRTPPPPDWVPPSGVCECGCGQRTGVARMTRPERDQYLGFPLRFIQGHNSRVLRPEETSHWKGGWYVDMYGYTWLRRPDHPNANSRGYILAHRAIYEDTRGVRLPKKGVIVHHLNGDKSDNRPENLIALNRMAHKKAHALANALISLFLDDKLLEAAKAHVREHGTLPDLEALTAAVYGHH